MSIAALIKAVEAGTAIPLSFICLSPEEHKHAFRAYNGSLDAAMALHEALLPGWDWTRWPQGDFEVGRAGLKARDIFTGASDIPARAWLLAILRAKEASHDRT